MRIFIVFEKDRHSLDVYDGQTVGQALETLTRKLRMNFNVGAQQKKYLVLQIRGSELKNDWVITDLGLEPGTTFKCYLKEEEQPSLRIFLSFSGDMIPIFDEINFYETAVSDVRSIIQTHTGMPVSTFKLIAQKNKRQLYDNMTLYDYDIRHGELLLLETWDGWGPLLHASLMDMPQKVHRCLMTEDDPMVARFQARVALSIAAHFGLTDLASKLVIGLGVRPDLPVGAHPATQWCGQRNHIDTLKAPIHVAAERDQLPFLKLIVAHNITYCMARDGRQLTALSVALRKNNRKSASLLITKAWSKVPAASEITFPLPIYTKIKKWCEMAKDEIFHTYSGEKSSAKYRKWYQKCRVNVNLVGQPLLLDGFSEDIMQSKFGRGKTIKSYDPNFRAATAQPKPKLPTIRIETPPLVKREKMKYEARKNGVTYGGIPNITEALGSDLQNPLSELRLHRSKTYDSSFTSSKKSSSTLPLKLSNSFDLSLDDNSKKQRPMSVMSRISTRNSDRQILLPSQPKFIHLTRPPVFDAHGGMTTDHLNQTISAVERKLGQSLREKAIDSLNVASTFKNKAWLHKINLANNLSRNAIQRKPLQLREQYL